MAKVLIIDDDDEVSAIFAEIIREAGHETERSAAAYGAVIRASRISFDLILMDLLLQGANGAVAALALRGLGYIGPILVITGGIMPIDKTVYEMAKFSGRLLKPVLPKELIEEINKFI